MSKLFFIAIFFLVILIPVSVYAAIPADVLRTYPTIGLKTGATAAAITQYIAMSGAKQLNLILTATGGNFNSTNLVIAVSQDNSTFITADTIALSTGTSKAIVYSDAQKATTLPINPASFPFIKVTTSAGVASVVEKLYWVGTQ